MILESLVATATFITLAVTILGMFFRLREKERALTPVFVGGEVTPHDDYLAVHMALRSRGQYIMVESVSAPGFELALADPRRLNVDLLIPAGGFAPYLNTSFPIFPDASTVDLFFCVRSAAANKVVIEFRIAERFFRVKYQLVKLPPTQTASERYEVREI